MHLRPSPCFFGTSIGKTVDDAQTLDVQRARVALREVPMQGRDVGDIDLCLGAVVDDIVLRRCDVYAVNVEVDIVSDAVLLLAEDEAEGLRRFGYRADRDTADRDRTEEAMLTLSGVLLPFLGRKRKPLATKGRVASL